MTSISSLVPAGELHLPAHRRPQSCVWRFWCHLGELLTREVEVSGACLLEVKNELTRQGQC